MYNLPSVVAFSNSKESHARTRMLNYLQAVEGTIEELSTNTVPNYIREGYLTSADRFLNRYKMSVDIYINSSG
jgi:hypothetical protein